MPNIKKWQQRQSQPAAGQSKKEHGRKQKRQHGVLRTEAHKQRGHYQPQAKGRQTGDGLSQRGEFHSHLHHLFTAVLQTRHCCKIGKDSYDCHGYYKYHIGVELRIGGKRHACDAGAQE